MKKSCKDKIDVKILKNIYHLSLFTAYKIILIIFLVINFLPQY